MLVLIVEIVCIFGAPQPLALSTLLRQPKVKHSSNSAKHLRSMPHAQPFRIPTSGLKYLRPLISVR